mmetsp:Transcript_24139/g.45818  ORF Transcript_24139/g.45818 Transcript_24139/m.45818 type:complete len:196 (-) Transcript_24139:1120-1707(-)
MVWALWRLILRILKTFKGARSGATDLPQAGKYLAARGDLPLEGCSASDALVAGLLTPVPEIDNRNESLLRAVRDGRVDEVRMLVQSKADVRVQDAGGDTSLHWAAYKGHTEMVKLLVQLQADVCARDNGGHTALHLAAFEGHTETVKAIVLLKADLRALDNNGHTALDLAASEGRSETVEALKELEVAATVCRPV